MLSRMTFFPKLARQILSGKKTATIRDVSDSHFFAGQVVDARVHGSEQYICQIEIIDIKPIQYHELNRSQAKAENLPFVFMLKWLIRRIYPGEQQLFYIQFKVHSE